MKRKLLSILVCAAMLLSCLSVFTYAATVDVEIDLSGLFDDVPEKPEGGESTTPDSGDDKEDDKDDNNKGNNTNKGNGGTGSSSKDDKSEEKPAPYGEVDLVAVADSLYEGIDKENMPMVMSLALTEENFEYFAFIPYDKSYEAAANEPMMGSIAHSIVLVKCADADTAKKVAEEMKAKCDPRKWICVTADIVEATTNNNIAMLLMTTKELGISETVLKNFAALDAEKIASLKSEVKEEVPAEWENPFTDVKESDWFYETVKYVNENGIINGMTEDTFAPATQLTRAMLVTILYRVEGSPEVESDSKFSDVKNSDWYGAPVIWAAENGIVNGVSETEFAPNNAITREQIAAIMYRYAGSKNIDTKLEGNGVAAFSDASTVSTWAKDAMSWAVNAKLINGKTETTVNPQDKATRAEAATIIMRFLESLA